MSAPEQAPTIRLVHGAPDEHELAAVIVALTRAVSCERSIEASDMPRPAVRNPFRPAGSWGCGARVW